MPFASLADFKAHLNVSSAAHDAELQQMLDAADGRVRALIGGFDGGQVTERVVPARGVVVLAGRPVIGNPSVVDGDGSAVAGWSLSREAGVMYDVPGSSPLTVTYNAGRVQVPPEVRLAVLITAAHLWETQRGQSPSPLALQDGSDNLEPPPGQGYALPRRARELLEPYVFESQAA